MSKMKRSSPSFDSITRAVSIAHIIPFFDARDASSFVRTSKYSQDLVAAARSQVLANAIRAETKCEWNDAIALFADAGMLLCSTYDKSLRQILDCIAVTHDNQHIIYRAVRVLENDSRTTKPVLELYQSALCLFGHVESLCQNPHINGPLHLLIEASNGGDVNASYSLYTRTSDVKWAKRAFEQNHSTVAWEYAQLIRYDQESEAMQWYTEGAKRGNIDCMLATSAAYAYGRVVYRDLERSFELFKQAVDVDALHHSVYFEANRFETGLNVPRSMVEAKRRYAYAHDHGNLECSIGLSEIFLSEDVIIAAAAIIETKSHVTGHEFAHQLTRMYSNGEGVSQDIERTVPVLATNKRGWFVIRRLLPFHKEAVVKALEGTPYDLLRICETVDGNIEPEIVVMACARYMRTAGLYRDAFRLYMFLADKRKQSEAYEAMVDMARKGEYVDTASLISTSSSKCE